MPRVREVLGAVLGASVFLAPLWGAPVTALGTVVSAQDAHLGGGAASVGATVFGGDRLSTDQAGRVQLRAGAARLLLSQSSTAILAEEDGIPSATLLGGTATFSTANVRAFALHASAAVIRPKDNAPTIGQVTLLSAKQLLVKCTRGALTIAVDDDMRMIPEGASYRILLEPEMSAAAKDQPPPRGAGSGWSDPQPHKAGRNRFMWVVAGVTGVVTYFVLDEALESPDRP